MRRSIKKPLTVKRAEPTIVIVWISFWILFGIVFVGWYLINVGTELYWWINVEQTTCTVIDTRLGTEDTFLPPPVSRYGINSQEQHVVRYYPEVFVKYEVAGVSHRDWTRVNHRSTYLNDYAAVAALIPFAPGKQVPLYSIPGTEMRRLSAVGLGVQDMLSGITFSALIFAMAFGCPWLVRWLGRRQRRRRKPRD